MTHVVVVGGGIAGLSCAYELAIMGPASPAVTVVEPDPPGGKLRCERLGDQLVDVGPDGFLARRPEASALVHELGAADRLEPVGALGAWVYARGRLRRLPEGLALGVPTRLRDLRTTTAIGMLGPLGAMRAGLDLVAPRRARRSALEDRAVGPLVADKLGRRVVDVLVDPLVGGIHAGRVRDLSAAAVYPPLLVAGQRRGSLMRALRQAPNADPRRGPAFLTLHDGLGTLPDLLVGALAARGVEVHRGAALALDRRAGGWSVATKAGDIEADALVLATPATVTATLLAPHDRAAARMLSGIDAASVATVTLRYRREDVELPEGGTGVLVPSSSRRGDDTYLLSAVTFLDRKWPHLRQEGWTLLRGSVGRIDDVRFEDLDDEALVARVHDELGTLLGVSGTPCDALVTRWPGAFPQYRVNHLARVDAIEAAVRTLGGVAVCGAAYRGVGIPACIASGRGAARAVRSALATQSS